MINEMENRMEEKKHVRKRGNELTQKQIIAIRLERKIGKEIARDYPEIADDYRQSSTLKNIVQDYKFSEKYELSENTAQIATLRALEILISKEERQILGKEHIRKEGLKKYEEGRGMFSLSYEDLEEWRRIGREKGQPISCKIAGRKVYNEKKGIFSRSKEKMKEDGIKGGKRLYELGLGIHAQSGEEKRKFNKMGLLARGYTPFSDEEKRYFFELCENPRYQHSIGARKGRPDYRLISEEIEKRYRIKRTTATLNNLMYKSRKGTK